MTRDKHISYAAAYLRWLATRVIEQEAKQIDPATAAQLDAMDARVKGRRPAKPKAPLTEARRGLDEVQQQTLLALVKAGSQKSPFRPVVQERNALVVLILYHLGLRAGELLGLRVDDIDLQENTLLVARRHADAIDPRTQQPVAKTLDRRIPVAAPLASQIASYILQVHSGVPFASREVV